MPRRVPVPLDLMDGEPYEVQLCRHTRGPAPEVLFEGETTFEITPMPSVRGYGDRWCIRPACAPHLEAVGTAGVSRHSSGYRTGSWMIEFSEAIFMVLMARDQRPDPDTMRAHLEMTLDVFCVQEGLDGVTFV